MNLSEKNVYNNPANYSGVWFVIHTEAYYCDSSNYESVSNYERFIKRIVTSLKCNKCRIHGLKYLDRNPVSDFLDITVEDENLGVFYWSWLFHNHVNERLGKTIMNFDNALDIYKNENMCYENCG